MPKRKNMIHMMRPANSAENNGGVMRNKDTDQIHIWWKASGEVTDHLQGLSTRDARLLAKRINSFLDSGG